jgi:Cu2+-containing amine oxidase
MVICTATAAIINVPCVHITGPSSANSHARIQFILDLLSNCTFPKNSIKMVLERVKQMAAQLTGQLPPPHPLDPLSSSEIKEAVAIVRKEHNDVFFNAVTLWEPRKKQMMAWLATPDTVERPHRVADVVAIGRGSKVFDGTVDLEEKKILNWELTEGVQPLVSTF